MLYTIVEYLSTTSGQLSLYPEYVLKSKCKKVPTASSYNSIKNTSAFSSWCVCLI